MKKVKFLIVAVIAVFLASCSAGRYVSNSTNLNLNQTQVVLSEANFKVVKTVQTYVVYKNTMKFDPEQLKQSAYASLLREADLKGAQTIINVTMEQVERVSGFGFTVQQTESAVLVTGTVIEFIK